MNKAVEPLLDAHIRPIAMNDFGFIRSLAAEFPTFTVPSEFQLWFFTRFHPDYCRVLEKEPGGLRAYLLSMPTSEPSSGIAIWQVAAARPNHSFALEYFAAYLHELVGRVGATSLFFTAPQDAASLRLIRVLAKKFGNCEVVQLNSVPAGQGEIEYKLSPNVSRLLK